ncbi:MAG: BatA domain-containing protein [Gloeobacteraceae cyanobacterium ES-bin-144]|nr:BatA domain-containing protein [Verrucomicrobiales bacterium]
MSFLNPMMLAALGAISAPIIIHLLNKFRVKTTEWGAMKFLLDSIQKNEKRVKIEDLLLLILRCLLIALAVFAFARPVLKALAGSASESGEAVAAAVLLDNSASMSQSLGTGTLFDLGKKEIAQWLDGQPSQSLTTLYLVSNKTEALIGKPSKDHGLFRKILSEAETTDHGSEIAQGVRLAIESLKTVSDLPREIRIYTDGQAKAWLKSDEIIKLAKENPDIRIVPVILGEKAPENAGIVALRTDGGIVAVGQPSRFHVEVGNYGTAALESVSIQLAVDGGPPAGQAIIPRIEPGATQAASISITAMNSGPHAIIATIPADAFADDNKRVLAVDVVRQMNVLIAEGNNQAPVMDRDGFFLSNALVPVPQEQISRFYLATLSLSASDLPSELSNKNNSAVRAVFLCNPGPLNPTVTQALQTYVRGGGNLIVFPGPLANGDDWKNNTKLAEMLPAEIGQPKDASPPIAFQTANFTHPVPALWNDAAHGSLSAVKFSRYVPLTLKSGAPRVLISFSTGEPAAVEWSHGEGHVVLFNSTATPEWNNFPLHPAFLPFMQRLMGYLNRQNESNLTLVPGETFRKPMDASFKGKDFSILRPGSDTSRTAGQVSATEDQQYFIRYAATDKAGAYKVSIDSEAVAMFAVQMDAAESDLRRVEPQVLAELGNIKPTDAPSAKPRMVVTKEFWTMLIWILAGLFLLEAIMAHRASHAR